MGKKIVIALGGNALGNTPGEQIEAVKQTAKSLVDLVVKGNKIIVGHGNGPQVGMINLAMETAHQTDAKIPAMPFPECGAMSQGYIGYQLQQALANELAKRGIDKTPVSILSQTLVDLKDPSFQNPTKPIGSYLEADEIKALEDQGKVVVEDSGRGYRQVVASPNPLAIVEEEAIRSLFDKGFVLIAGGGGGVPVVKEGGFLQGVDAVIDKDMTSVLLAEIIGADKLVILTAVDKVAINFGKPTEKWLDKISPEEGSAYLEAGEFGKGSMEPKVRAGLKFVGQDPRRSCLITSLEKAAQGLKGKTGTIIRS